MGLIKELRDKLAAGTISDEEKAQLAELEAEAKEGTEDEDKLIDELAEKLTNSVMGRIEEKTKKEEKKEEKKLPAGDGIVRSPKLVYDSKMGEVSVEKLDSIKIELPNREGKKFKEVSAKTIHFLNALVTGDQQKLQVLVEGTASRGGYLVPEDFANILVEDIRDESVMRQLATVIQTSSDTLHLPSLASRPQVAWRSEGATKQTSTVDFAENVFTPYSLAGIVGLSQELVDDASLGVNGSIANYVAAVLSTAIREEEEEAFWTGNGSGKPTGVDNYTLNLITATGTAASQADSVVNTAMRLGQGYRRRGVWVANGATLASLATLKDNNGNYLMGSLAGAPSDTLRGRPFYEVNSLPNGKAFFGDFGYYYIVENNGISVRLSDEATVAGQSAFERNLVFVRVEHRVDGELVLPAAVREINGL